MAKKTKIYYFSSFAQKISFSAAIIFFFFTLPTSHLIAQIRDGEYEAAKAIRDRALRAENQVEKKKPQRADKPKIVTKGKSVHLTKKRLEGLMTALTKKMKKSFYKNLKCKEKYFAKNSKVTKACLNFPNKILITSLNIYSENIKISDIKMFNNKLTNLDVPKYKFEIRKSKNAFKIRQIAQKKTLRIVRGPIDNIELTKFVLKEGFKHYAEFYLYISPRRALLEVYIFDGTTHKLKWSDWQSVVYNPIYLNFTTGIHVSFIKKPSFIMLHTATGFYIRDFGNLSIYFDLGFSSSRRSTPASSIGAYDNISIGVAVGGLLSFNMVEIITQKKHCCDFVITVGPGMFFDIPLTNTSATNSATPSTPETPEGLTQEEQDALAASTEEETSTTQMDTSVKSQFIIPIGVKIPFENFSVSFDFDPMRKAASIGFNYEF